MSISKIKIVNFGRSRAGYGGSIGYRLINPGGSATTSRTSVGISEIGSGIYFASVSIPGSWDGMILWDDGQTPRLYAVESHYHDSLGSSIANQIWNASSLNFLSPDTFGQRIDYIKRESSYRGALVAGIPPAISEEEKKKIFGFLELTINKIKSIEVSLKSEIANFLKPLQKELFRYQNSLTKLSMRVAKGEETNLRRALGELTFLSSRLNDLEHFFKEIDAKFSTRQKSADVSSEQRFTRVEKTISFTFEEVRKNLLEDFNSTKIKIGEIITLCEQLKASSDSQEKQFELRDKLLIKMADSKILLETVNEIRNPD